MVTREKIEETIQLVSQIDLVNRQILILLEDGLITKRRITVDREGLFQDYKAKKAELKKLVAKLP